MIASPAMAGFTAASAGPHNSDGTLEAPTFPPVYNGYFTYDYAGPDFNIGDIIFSGTLTDQGINSYENEARINITDPFGTTAGFQPGTQEAGWGSTTWTDEAISGAGGYWNGTAGTWVISFSESVDDGGPGDVDAIWTDFFLEFTDLVVVEPTGTPLDVPADVDGNLAAVGDVDWYTFTAEGGVMDFYTGPADPSEIEDTEIGIYDMAGALVATNDDGGPFGDGIDGFYSGLMGMTLPAGDYYIAVAAYNSAFGLAGWAVTGGEDYTGDYNLVITPEPATLALFGFGVLALIRRR